MSYEVIKEILQLMAEDPNHMFTIEELENEIPYSKQNIQQALYRARKRGEVERVTPGMYRLKTRGGISKKKKLGYSKGDSININTDDFELYIPNVSIRIIDEIIGQLKFIRNNL